MSNYRILVVEDDQSGRQLVDNLLTHFGCTVDSTDNPMQALDWVEIQQYDLAVLDLSLPSMSGWELLKAFSNAGLTATMPCIAVTAYHSPETRQSALNAGFYAYLPKPLDVRSLYAELTTIINRDV
ncbi:MAG: response regulator [Phototrophicaceae bacterium]